MPRDYSALTPRGQARRLRALAHEAAAEFKFADYHLSLIKHLNNTTFRLDSADGRFLLRIHRSKNRTPAEIDSEVMWLEAIAQDGEICVQAPRRTRTNRLLAVCSSPGVPEPYPVTVLSWIEGRILPSANRRVHHFTKVGRLTGLLHRHSDHWQRPAHFARPRLDAEGLLGAAAPYSLREFGPLLPNSVRHDIEAVYARLCSVEAELEPRAELHGLLHGDLSFSNVLFAAGQARPIDFDEGGVGCYLFDIGLSLNGARWNDHYAEHRDAYIEGYRQVRNLDDGVLVHLPLYMAVRTARMVLWAASLSPTHDWIDSMGTWIHELLGDINAGESAN